MIDIETIKQQAHGRWPELLARIGGLDSQLLDGKREHPCPKCGGKTRFRLIDREAGALYCNQCFNHGNGDGIAALMWLTGMSFPETVARLADELGVSPQQRPQVNLVQEMAWRKGVPSWSLETFGAEMAMRDKLPVCRVPMYDADMQVVGHFDMAPMDGFDKGRTLKGSKLGLFIAAEPPHDGDLVCVVEGVKDAAALHALGIKAVGLPTCRMDAGFARFFRGCHVVIIPDRDKAGLEGAAQTAARLYGVALSVKVAELPAEYRETGGADVRDVLRAADGERKLRECISKAKLWTAADGNTRPIVLHSLALAVEAVIGEQGRPSALLTLGLPDVDHAIGGGVAAGELVLIAGRPGHGKTMVGLQALDHLSTQTPVLMISEEMPLAQLATRELAGIATIPANDWPTRKAELMGEAARHFADRKPILVVESCGTAERAIEAIAHAKQEHDIGAVAVDYVQLLRGEGNSRYEQVSDTSMKLKQAAMLHKVVLLGLCQLSRGIESRKSTTPMMSDLRDSGQLEQDADVILFVEWMHRSAPDAHMKGEYRICVGKNRSRPIVRSLVECVFQPEKQRLYPKARVSDPTPYDDFAAYSESF